MAIEQNLDAIKQYISDLSNERFYGAIKLEFSDGKVVLIKKHESFKPGLLVTAE